MPPSERTPNDAAPSDGTASGSVASTGVVKLLDGLPATLDALLAHPERHRPVVVERLLEVTDELRRDNSQTALALAETAQHLAAKIPAFFPRGERFRLRAKSFEVWASLQRSLGDGLSAEGGFTLALELLTQIDPQQTQALSTVLGRNALVAGDRRDDRAVSRYVEAGVEIAQALEDGEPFAAIRPMIEAVMEEDDAVLPTMFVVLFLVANTATVPEDAGPEAVGTLTTELDIGKEVARQRAGTARGLPASQGPGRRWLAVEALGPAPALQSAGVRRPPRASGAVGGEAWGVGGRGGYWLEGVLVGAGLA